MLYQIKHNTQKRPSMALDGLIIYRLQLRFPCRGRDCKIFGLIRCTFDACPTAWSNLVQV